MLPFQPPRTQLAEKVTKVTVTILSPLLLYMYTYILPVNNCLWITNLCIVCCKIELAMYYVLHNSKVTTKRKGITMDFTTYSNELNRALTFFTDGNYIWIDINGMSGVLGKQVCRNGQMTGQPLQASVKTEYFYAQCLAWLEKFVEFVTEYELFDEYSK